MVSRPTLVLALALVSALSAGCTRPATQLVVVVDSDLPTVGCYGVRVSRIVDGVLEPGATRTFLPGTQARPFSFGVTPPDGNPAQRVEVAVEALASCADPLPDERVVRRAVRTGFLAQQTLRLAMFLPASCGAGCTATETCPAVGPECQPIPTIEPTTLDPVSAGQELLDAGVSAVDAQALDASGPDAAGVVLDAAPVADGGLSASCTMRSASSWAGIGDTAVDVAASGSSWRVFHSRQRYSDTVGGTTTLIFEPLSPAGMSSVTLSQLAAVEAGGEVLLFGNIDMPSEHPGVLVWHDPYASLATLIADGTLAEAGAVVLGTGEVVIAADVATDRSLHLVSADSATTLGRLGAAGTPTALAAGAQAYVATGGDGACAVRTVSAARLGTAIDVPVVGQCASVALAELAPNRVLLAHVSGEAASRLYAYQVVDLGAGTVGEPVVLGTAPATPRLLAAGDGSSSASLAWLDGTAISHVRVDASGALGARDCVVDGTGGSPSYETFALAARGPVSGVFFVGGTRSGILYAELP